MDVFSCPAGAVEVLTGEGFAEWAVAVAGADLACGSGEREDVAIRIGVGVADVPSGGAANGAFHGKQTTDTACAFERA